MAINSTQSSTSEQVTETAEVTVRVPRSTTGTLFESAESRLSNLSAVTMVTLTGSDGIDPRNGSTHVTVIGEFTVTGITDPMEIVEVLEDAVCVETAALTGVT